MRCQVKSNQWPRTVEMETLRDFPAPHERAQARASVAGSAAGTGRAGGVKVESGSCASKPGTSCRSSGVAGARQ